MSSLSQKLTRRAFCVFTGASMLGACSGFGDSAFPRDGRLTARPRDGIPTSASGMVTLEMDHARKAFLQLPKDAGGTSPLRLLVMLHGATQSAQDMFAYLDTTPMEAGIAVLAPNSRDTTWDAIGGSFGRDVVSLNLALERVFETVAIDPARVAIGGFSDGASYAISLGLINGDLFRSVVAFSPGYVVSGTPLGKPRIFISHGTHDRILPIDRCGKRIAATLISHGYDVTFREFDGDHEIPTAIAREGLSFV